MHGTAGSRIIVSTERLGRRPGLAAARKEAAMECAIRVKLAREVDTGPLKSYLAGRGFVVRRVGDDGATTLDVVDPAVEDDRLAGEVWDAMTSWLDASGTPLVPTVVEPREYALVPPGD